jgi:hypothetical protein
MLLTYLLMATLPISTKKTQRSAEITTVDWICALLFSSLTVQCERDLFCLCQIAETALNLLPTLPAFATLLPTPIPAHILQRALSERPSCRFQQFVWKTGTAVEIKDGEKSTGGR